MAIPSAGSALSLSAIQTEFGGSNPISMSEYYAGGSNVPSGTTGDAGNIPSSGAIAVSQFYGSSNRIAIALTISSTTQSYNIYSNRGGTYSAGNSDVTLTVQAIVGSTGASGLDTGSQWTSGDTIKIINNSQIVGKGNAGGAGGARSGAGSAGTAGQAAINLGYPVTIQNNGGFIRGGGGGGGGGAGGSFTQPGGGQKGQTPTTVQFGGGGGGGGAGQQGGAGGAAGQTNSSTGATAAAGAAGSISGAGAGGDGSAQGSGSDGGGSGGHFGNAGAAGQSSNQASGGGGGAAGKGINLNGNQVTWEDGQSNVQGAVS
tara:strand:+ start:2275 stop:3222 length:948 start_codon:yes stop_codon:yes gene_type:complete